MNATVVGVTSGIITAGVVGLAAAASESHPDSKSVVPPALIGGLWAGGLAGTSWLVVGAPKMTGALAGIGAGAITGALLGSSIVKLLD